MTAKPHVKLVCAHADGSRQEIPVEADPDRPHHWRLVTPYTVQIGDEFWWEIGVQGDYAAGMLKPQPNMTIDTLRTNLGRSEGEREDPINGGSRDTDHG